MSISLDWLSKVSYSLFLLYIQVESYQNILKLSCRPLAFTSRKAFKRQKQVWNYSPCLIFWMTFEEKYLFCYKLTKFHCLVPFTSWNIEQGTVCQPGCGDINFEISFTFPIQPFSTWPKKSRQKLEYLENKKNF